MAQVWVERVGQFHNILKGDCTPDICATSMSQRPTSKWLKRKCLSRGAITVDSPVSLIPEPFEHFLCVPYLNSLPSVLISEDNIHTF
jgi:hypothetical protein